MDNDFFEKLQKYIDYHSLATLGTIDEHGNPHGAVVYICIDDHKPTVYFMTKVGTRKYKNIENNSMVSLTIVSPESVTTLQATGTAYTVNDAKIIDDICKKITRSHAWAEEWLPPIAKLNAGPYTMVGIDLDNIRLGDFKGKKIGDEGIFTVG